MTTLSSVRACLSVDMDIHVKAGEKRQIINK
jgi:hypothetical protein